MKIMEDIRPVSYLKANTADMLKQINETHRPVIITQNGEPRGVLQDPESYERMRTAVNMMRLLAPGLDEARHGKGVDQDEMFERLMLRLKNRKRRETHAS